MTDISSSPLHKPGARVLIVNDRATVRYVGTVAGQEGRWAGVEWDDASRGKHDGMTGGVRYFGPTASGPTACSFVRIEKVDFGLSVLEALHLRYTNQRGELGEVAADEMYVHTVRQRKVQIEVVGIEKIKALQSMTNKLVTARLVNAHISHVGDAEALRDAGASLAELDLTANLISDWDFVQQLMAALPNLQALNLSGNRLELPQAPSPTWPPPPLTQLRALVLNDSGVSWQQVAALEPSLPNLGEVHLAGNSITSLRPDGSSGGSIGHSSGQEEGLAGGERHVTGFSSLQVLSLDDNGLREWREVARLSRLPSLKKLSLSGNPLPRITWHETVTAPAPGGTAAVAAAAQGAEKPGEAGAAGAGAEARGVGFESLQALYLAGCGLGSWSDVDALNALPALCELRVTGNPVLQLSKSGGRFEVIGRVARLTQLNGADVKPRERRDAELRYLQNALAELEDAGDVEARDAAAAAHPRLRELSARYGEVMGSGGGGAGGSVMSSALVELKLTCVAAGGGAKMGSQVKKLPRTTTIAALRVLCDKLFKVRPGHQALFVRAPGDPLPEEVGGEDDSRTLGFFGLQDGYEVLVDEIDPAARNAAAADARAKEVADHEARLASQLKTAEVLAAEMGRSLGLEPGAGAPVVL